MFPMVVNSRASLVSTIQEILFTDKFQLRNVYSNYFEKQGAFSPKLDEELLGGNIFRYFSVEHILK
jgi:hypothetical protein